MASLNEKLSKIPSRQLNSKQVENSLKANILPLIRNNDVITCRAIWRVKRQDFNLANDVIASKRLQLDEVVSQVKGVMLFFSSVGGVTSNRPKKKPEKDSKTSKQREDSNEEKKAQDTGDKTADQPGENKDLDIPYPAVSYFIICRRGLADAASNIHKALHEAETEVEVKELKTKKKNVGEEKEVLAKLCQVLKDHNSSYAQSLLRSSVDFCYNQALRHNLEETSDEEKWRLFPFLTASADDTSLKDLKVPKRLTVIDMEEYGIEIAAAIKNLKRDGLECVFKDSSNLQPFVNLDLSFGDSNSELLQVIKKLGLMMSSLGHALYKGDIYVKPPSAKFTYVLMMDVESYINKLMISDVIGEEIVKFAKRIIEIMCHPECEVIKQIKFNWDLVEVKDGKCFSISNRDFIECPIDLKDIGLISPRAFAPYYDSSKDPAPSYFKESIENSFPNLATRINFLNKYYQCLTVNKFPHKCPKLVVAGPRDSGKTTWASVFLSIIPFRYIASITKEKTFSTAMINADTQLVLLDEWSPDHLQSDTAKLLLQGGLMISAVKYEKARTFINNSAFYITTNNVPIFGEDEDANVKRRLKIFETRSMPNPNSKIEPWYRQNSMHCIAWVAKEITKHRALVEKDELWYEDVSNERGEAEKIADLANGGGAAFFDVDKVKNLKFKDIFGPDTEKEKSDEKTIDEEAEPDSLIHESFISEAQTTIEKRKTDLEHTNTIEEEQWHMSQDDDDENLNTENHQKGIFEELQSNFFRSSLNNNHLKIFLQKQEGLKIPKRTRDAEYDGWCLVVGEPRPEFDLELFLQRHPTARRQIDRIRDMVSLRIMPENDSIKVPEVQQDNAAGVLGMVIDFFKQASKKIKLS